jgi:hypothetical protein
MNSVDCGLDGESKRGEKSSRDWWKTGRDTSGALVGGWIKKDREGFVLWRSTLEETLLEYGDDDDDDDDDDDATHNFK